MTVPTFVDPRREAEFAANGFVRMRLMTADAAARLRTTLLAMLPGPATPNSGSIYSSVSDADPVTRAAFRERVAAVLPPLLKPHIVGGSPRETGIIVKLAGGPPVGLHHHAPFTERPFERTLICWLALTDADARTSALQMIPNSHQILPHIAVPGEPPYFAPFRNELNAAATSADVGAGEAVIFEQTLIHGSSANHGTTDRVALTCMLTAPDRHHAIFIPRGENRFEIFDTGSEGSVAAYYAGRTTPGSWRSLGTVANRNRTVTLAEFEQLVAQSDKADDDHDPLAAIRAASPSPSRGVGRTSDIAKRLRAGLAQAIRRILQR